MQLDEQKRWRPYTVSLDVEELCFIHDNLTVYGLRYETFVMDCYKLNEQLRSIINQQVK